MEMKKEIQLQITASGGSEKRIINRTIEKCRCSENDVRECLIWLRKQGFIKIINCPEMTENEKRYYDSDLCPIYRNISYYDEVKYYEEEFKRKQAEELLTNTEKFKLYFSKMENNFDFNYIYNSKNYLLTYGENDVTVLIIDENREVKIDFALITKLTYNDAENNIFYCINEQYKTIELYYMHGMCNFKQYNN